MYLLNNISFPFSFFEVIDLLAEMLHSFGTCKANTAYRYYAPHSLTNDNVFVEHLLV